MIIYNITFHIEKEVLEDCLLFLKETYIPMALEGKALESPQLCKVMGQEEGDNYSYALQFHVENTRLLNDWWKLHGEELNALLTARYADKVVGFTTLLEKLDHTRQ